MKVVFFGGSFDPFHNGHLYIAEEALYRLKADRLVFIPAGQSPFKKASPGARAADRLAMLKAAAACDSRFSVDDRELSRPGPSWTVETLSQLIAELGIPREDGDLPDIDRAKRGPWLLMGDDLAEGFHRWREPGRILSMVTVVVARRATAGYTGDGAAGESAAGESASPGGLATTREPFFHLELPNRSFPLSSSELRARIASGAPFDSLLPRACAEYIKEKALYGYRG